MNKVFSGIIVLSIIFFTHNSNIQAQQDFTSSSKSAIKAYEKGVGYLRSRQYEDARESLLKAIDKDPEFIEPYLMMGELYIEQRKPEEAIDYYAKGVKINPDFYPPGLLVLGKLYLSIGDYQHAKPVLEKYLASGHNNTRFRKEANEKLRQAEFGIRATNNPVPFDPVNLGPMINTEYDDYWPSLSADEQTLIYTVLLPKDPANPKIFGNRQEDFFIAHKKDTVWQQGKPAGKPLNTDDNEGAQTITADGKWMFFTACNRPDGEGQCDIYFSQLENGQWSDPVNIGKPINTGRKETQPSVSADGRKLFFVSDRPGGYGGLDIWMSTRTDKGNWSLPRNLGEKINTSGDDISPFIHLDNKTLYFSSDKHTGMGGLDMFKTVLDSTGEWTAPENLGYPLNTHLDEFGLTINAAGNTAYFSSDREGQNNKDIYKFVVHPEARPTPVAYMKGVVYDANTRERLRAQFELKDLQTGELVTSAFSDASTGEFLISIPTNNDYALNVEKSGYLFYSDNFSLKGVYKRVAPFHKDVPLKPLTVGESIVLKNVFFETDSYKLDPRSKVELHTVARMMENNPSLTVEISGHTDNIGTQDYNQKLSEQRARSVVEFLVENGIKQTRLSHQGYGMEQPVASNETEEGRARNRRTELKIKSL